MALWHQGGKRVPGTAVTKSVVAPDRGGKKRDEVFVDVIEKISCTFNAAVRGGGGWLGPGGWGLGVGGGRMVWA